MVEVQVQIPDLLYAEVKRLPAGNEMSVAEVVRLGLERIVASHPSSLAAPPEWTLPPAFDLGVPLALEEAWTELCRG